MFGFAVEALPGPHFGGERSVDPRGEGRVGTKFGGNARMHAWPYTGRQVEGST